MQRGRGGFRRLPAQVEAGHSGGRVGDAGVDDHCLRLAVLMQDRLIPEDRRGFKLIGGKGPGDRAGNRAADHGHIHPALIFDTGLAGSGLKALCRGDASGDCFHGQSSSPINRVMFFSFSTNS